MALSHLTTHQSTLTATVGDAFRLMPDEGHTNTAMHRLSNSFWRLTQVGQTSEQFVRELHRVLIERRGKPAGQQFRIDKHTVFGLSQLVHRMRDATSGSTREGFVRLIPHFLRMKEVARDGDVSDLANFVFEEVERLLKPDERLD